MASPSSSTGETKEVKTKMPKKDIKKEPTLSDVLKAIEGISQRVNTLEKVPLDEVKEEIKKDETKFPIPMEYRELIDSILNAKFGIAVDPMADSPSFTFVISVPKEYSNMSDDEWKLKRADTRSKVISYAEGINGVREWCERVWKNLGPDRQALVTADRVRLVKNA